jgi:SNF2 family DNA or RNA helicase
MRLCLTGTPLENDLFELKNLFDYILPNYLGSDAEFKRKYLATEGVTPIADLELQRIIHPFKMRRKKVDVLKDLPEKVEDLRYCHLRKEQHKLYLEALALKGAPLIDSLRKAGGPVPYIHVFSVITLLKQICDDPGLVDSRYDEVGSGKLEVLDELLEEAMASDQKVVIFTQYAKMVHRLSTRLNRANIRHVILTGSTTRRGDVVREFQENKDVKVFLGSLLAGGAGIDLTAASMVIHFDRWWNAAKENQATDRIHRIGQERNVQVYKLITRGTLEERIDDIINRKRAVFERFVEQDAEVFRHLTREDLLNLLATPSELSAGVDIESEEDALRNVVEEIPL